MTGDHDLIWRALAHGDRRRIVDLLRDEPATTGSIVAATGLDRFVILRHLGVLREAGLVLVTARGRERYNALNASALYQATVGWLSPVARRYATGLDRLRGKLEAATDREERVDVQRLQVTQQIKIGASPDRCFEALAGDISSWWGSPYLIIDRPETRLVVEPRLGGLVAEHAADHDYVWGTVSELRPGRLVAWTGRLGLGPAATGTVSYSLTPSDTGTTVDLVHESIGPFAPDEERCYSHGWRDLLLRLKVSLEEGVWYGAAGKNCPPPDMASREEHA